MGTTYYVNRNIPLFGVYTCSKCKSVLLLQFQLKAAGASTWSQKKATEAMDEQAQKLLNALQNFQEKPFLITVDREDRSWTTGYEVGFENGDHHCPYCGNHEIWQRGNYYADACKKDPETGVSIVPDCPQESRMIVFSSVESATNEMKKRLIIQKFELEKHWAQHAGEAEPIKSQIGLMKFKLADLEPRKAAAKDKSKALSAQMADLEAEMKHMSLFSAEKKAAKAELKALKARYDAQRDADILEERRLAEMIESLEKQLKDLKIDHPGILNEIEQVDSPGEFVHIAGRVC